MSSTTAKYVDRLLESEALLASVKRSVMWGKLTVTTVGDEVDTEYGFPYAIDGTVLKSYADLIFAISGADGTLGDLEEKNIRKRFDLIGINKLSSSELESSLKHLSSVILSVRQGKYKNVSLEVVKSLIDKHVENMEAKAGKNDFFRRVAARATLFDAVEAAYADGYAAEENEAALKVATVFGVDRNEFDTITEYCKLVARANNDPTLKKNNDFLNEVKKFHQTVISKLPKSS